MASQSLSTFSSSVDTACVSRKGHPGVVEIVLDQLTPQLVARFFSMRFGWANIRYSTCGVFLTHKLG